MTYHEESYTDPPAIPAMHPLVLTDDDYAGEEFCAINRIDRRTHLFRTVVPSMPGFRPRSSYDHLVVLGAPSITGVQAVDLAMRLRRLDEESFRRAAEVLNGLVVEGSGERSA
ncbi:hypothetical protein PQI66_00265 [Corynebacterium sp. USCH3]|uniref:hypothetical protein n=1 Tax=Corynebacterium sp. USCH3 TaxID=3024840 RepID=UPI0030AEC48B